MKSIDVISIPVSDQQKAMAFYSRLGFELLADNEMGNNRRWLQMGFKGNSTTITLVTWFKQMPPGSVQGLVIRTDSFDEDVKELRENGIEITRLEQTEWGKFASFKDPDGNGLSLQQRNE
ncbi:MAG TPA: VOC family protein [Bacteroidia bacterium]|mgnify:CR=1 FL=1|nr:VOC family protein [Bacteroidia bacterium]